MEVILLEKVLKLGDPGDLVNVRKGYARNFLIPQGKAIRADDQNKAEYEQRRISLEKAEEARKNEALEVSISTAASEEGSLYGSIGTREIQEAILLLGLEIEKSSIRLPKGTLKELGSYQVDIELHPEVVQPITIQVIEKQV